MKKALITGVTGQDGHYLSQLLLQKGYEVIGISTGSKSNGGVLDSRITYVAGNLTDEAFVRNVLETHQPDEIYNLGARIMTAEPWRDVASVTVVAAFTPLYILEWVREKSPTTRLFQASSSEIYGNTDESPQNEETPCLPQNPYGIGKLFAHQMTRYYRKEFGLYASSGILFTHESPLRGPQFVTRKITSTLNKIAQGAQVVLELGNLDVQRDWSFAGDIVEGAWLSLQAGIADDYVFGSGESHSVREFVEVAARLLGLTLHWEGSGKDEKGLDTNGKVIVAVNPQFYRPAEPVPRQGDITKARSVLGWEPQTSFEQLVEMMVRAEV